MGKPNRRLSDAVAQADYLNDLGERPLEDLRRMRDECRDAENEMSFERRLCHARIDILSAEIERRRTGSSEALVDRLPEILAGDFAGGSDPLPARAPDLSIPRNADLPRRRIDEIVGEQTLAKLTQVTVEELAKIVDSLRMHEHELSERRRRLHEIMDRIQSEIVRRFTSGEADPSETLENL